MEVFNQVLFNGKVYEKADDDSWLPIIQLLVVSEFEITNEQFHGPKKNWQVADARKVFCWVACRLKGYSYSRIGKYLDHNQHTTVRKNVMDIDMWLEREYPIAKKIKRIAEQL